MILSIVGVNWEEAEQMSDRGKIIVLVRTPCLLAATNIHDAAVVVAYWLGSGSWARAHNNSKAKT